MRELCIDYNLFNLQMMYVFSPKIEEKEKMFPYCRVKNVKNGSFLFVFNKIDYLCR